MTTLPLISQTCLAKLPNALASSNRARVRHVSPSRQMLARTNRGRRGLAYDGAECAVLERACALQVAQRQPQRLLLFVLQAARRWLRLAQPVPCPQRALDETTYVDRFRRCRLGAYGGRCRGCSACMSAAAPTASAPRTASLPPPAPPPRQPRSSCPCPAHVAPPAAACPKSRPNVQPNRSQMCRHSFRKSSLETSLETSLGTSLNFAQR
eukprot:COSAG04_NODE_190_length_20948_cov_7.298863_3_plen_210_part_00